MNEVNIYTTLDSLLDTRMGLLLVLNKDIFRDAVKTGEYFKRDKDSFGVLNTSIFSEIYRHRNKDILKISKPTKIFQLINDYIEHINLINIGLKEKNRINIFINAFPYKFTDALADELLKSLLPYFINADNVNIIDVEIPKFEWFKNMTLVVDYNGANLLDKYSHVEEFKKGELLDTIIVLPKILEYSDVVEERDFENFEEMMKILVDINFIDVEDFSVVLK